MPPSHFFSLFLHVSFFERSLNTGNTDVNCSGKGSVMKFTPSFITNRFVKVAILYVSRDVQGRKNSQKSRSSSLLSQSKSKVHDWNYLLQLCFYHNFELQNILYWRYLYQYFPLHGTGILLVVLKSTTIINYSIWSCWITAFTITQPPVNKMPRVCALIDETSPIPKSFKPRRIRPTTSGHCRAGCVG